MSLVIVELLLLLGLGLRVQNSREIWPEDGMTMHGTAHLAHRTVTGVHGSGGTKCRRHLVGCTAIRVGRSGGLA